MTVFSNSFNLTAQSGPAVGPTVAASSFVNVDFSNVATPTTLGPQTVARTIYGVGAGAWVGDPAPTTHMSDPTFQTIMKSLDFPLLRVNGISSALEGFFNGAGSASQANLQNWLGYFITNVYKNFNPGTQIVFGIGRNFQTWTSANAFAGACGAVAGFFNTTNSPDTNNKLTNLCFELGNESNNEGTSEATYDSYFAAGAAAIKAVNPAFKVFGPTYSYANNIQAFVNAVGPTNVDAVNYHFYAYTAQSEFDALAGGGVNSLLQGIGTAGHNMGQYVSAGVSGNIPIMIGEWNQNGVPGTANGGDNPGSCNVNQANYVGAVYNAQSLLLALNASTNFQMAAYWGVAVDQDYSVIGAIDVPGGGNTVSPGGLFLSKAGSVLYGTRVSGARGSGNPVLNILAVKGGPSSTNCAVMLINGSPTNQYQGQVALSKWPVNANGNATANTWLVGSQNTTSTASTVAVTAGLTGTVTVPPASVLIISV